jgi:hypothetical protein
MTKVTKKLAKFYEKQKELEKKKEQAKKDGK